MPGLEEWSSSADARRKARTRGTEFGLRPAAADLSRSRALPTPRIECVHGPLPRHRWRRLHRIASRRRTAAPRRVGARGRQPLHGQAREPAGRKRRRAGRRGPGRRRGRAAGGRRVRVRPAPGGDPVRAALGEGSAHVSSRQRRRDAASAPRRPRSRREARRLRRVLVGVRRHGRAAEARGHAAAAAVAVRAAEADRRAVLPAVLEALRARDRRHPVLQRVRPAPGSGLAVLRRDFAVRATRWRKAARRRSTATANRRATSRSSATSCRASCWRATPPTCPAK